MKETEIKAAIEFIKNTLKIYIHKFPQTRIRYEYDADAEVHTVEVVPNEVYHLNKQYIDWENTFTDAFITQFPDQNIGFISDDALVGLDNVDFELKGKDYFGTVSINNEDVLVSETLIEVYTDYITIDSFNTSLEPFNNVRIEANSSEFLTIGIVNSKFEINAVCIENTPFNPNLFQAA